MAVITFSINASQVQSLQGFKQGEESNNLTAKRILLNAIGHSPEAEHFPAHSKELQELKGRIEAIEIAIEADHFPSPVEELDEILKRIEVIEKKLGQPTTIALDPGDREKWVICLVGDGRPQKFWDGQTWIDQIEQANRYQSETSLRRTLKKLKTRKRERLDWEIRYNSIANLEKIMDSFQKDEGN
jgi:hypothetical protein